MYTNETELQARIWCFENDVNILQVCGWEEGGFVSVVLEYSMMDLSTNKKAWAKMAIMSDSYSIMSAAKEQVMQVRSAYYASKQQ